MRLSLGALGGGLLLAVLPLAAARDTALLREVASNWLGERDHWAFTQQVREFQGKELKQQRLERYDPSMGEASRWRLISIDGRKPTPAEWQDWYRRKYRKHHHDKGSVADDFDFDGAKVIEETPTVLRYELPLRHTVDWLFPVSKVELIVTISKQGPALEQVQARISEPFKVALGLARVLDIDLDLQMAPPPPEKPADAKPSGTARAVVTKLGERVEYSWSDFKRVEPKRNSAG